MTYHNEYYDGENTMDVFNKICLQLDLGKIITEPTQLQGGFMHKMYSLFTTKGKYAIKLLNPYVMKRDTVFENYRIAEELEVKLEQTIIPILPALTINGKKMQEIDGQYFYLFDFYEGESLKGEEITIEYCQKIGEFLAKIHNNEKLSQPYNRNEINVDWDMLIEKLLANNTELRALLSTNRDILYGSQQKGNLATKKMPPVLTICHNDMDSKNVLWNGNDCRIIDLECLCYSSPFVELYEMALCWSGYENCNIDFSLFKALIKSYADDGGELPDDWKTIYYSSYGRLEWLEYNVKRALGIECGEDEIEMGISEVRETMEHIVYYHNVRDEILECLKSL